MITHFRCPLMVRRIGVWAVYLGILAAFLLVAEGVYGMLFWPDHHAQALSANMLPNFTVSMAMVLMAYLIRQRHLSGFAVAVLIVIATLNAEYSLLERAFMATVGGEPIARSATAPLYLVIMIILGIRLVPKANRSIDRLFVLLIGVMVAISGTLFHLVLIDHNMHQIADNNKHTMEWIARTSSDKAFKNTCKEFGFECHQAPMGSKFTHADPRYSAFIGMIQSGAARQRPVMYASRHFEIRGDHASQVTYAQDGHEYRVIIDARGAYDRAFDYATIYYAGLCFASHAFWIFGGLWLLRYHRRRGAGRRRPSPLAAG